MFASQNVHPWRTGQARAHHWLALFIMLLLAISSGILWRPAPAAAQATLTCVNKPTAADSVGYAIYGVYASGNTIYASSAPIAVFSGKLSISTDGGVTFTNKTTANGLGSNAVRGVAVAGGIVYVATGAGLSISTDGGASFTNKTTANGLGNNAVWGVYGGGSNIYAATTGGVSISTDGGATFSNKTTANGLGSNAVWGGVYAAGSTIYAATNNGLAISTDGGATFSNKTTVDGLGNNNVRGVYASGSTVYAATDGGLSISTNGGATFSNKTTVDGLGNNLVSGVYASGSTVYAATNGGLSISTDSGATFTNYTTTNGLVANALASVYAVGSTVYVGAFGGLSICTLSSPPVSQVQGKGVTIASGDTTPSTADGTDLGSTTSGSSLVQAFTISNPGTADLTNVAVTLSGASAFSVSSQPSATISPGSSSTFTVTFAPSTSGVVTATVNFTSNQAPYTFVVQGTGTTPGAALDFDGADDYVSLPATLNNQFANNRISVEGWFYPTASSGSGMPMLIGEEYTGDARISFTLYQQGTAVYCGFYNAGWQQTDAVNLTLNQWQHLACTYDQQTIKLYVNGVVAATKAATDPLPTGNGAWYLGRRWDAAEYYTGRMDEIRIWNRALSQSEIQTNMNCEVLNTATGLVARYGFNQGQAQGANSSVTSLSDASGHSYQGSLTNFALTGNTSNWVAPGSAASGVTCVATPLIDVQGNGVSIINGATQPNTTDDTDFGRQTTGATVAHTFTLNNSGDAALTGVAVTVAGSSAFQLTGAPASNVAVGGSSNFTLSFTPSAVGAYTATVHIASNANPYSFVVLGVWTGSNVAIGQPATQSSTYDDPCTGPAANAVDGNTSGDPSACSFSTTNNEAPQDWWQVDLGAPYLIQAIDLWNRTDCCSERLSNFDLLVSTDGVNWTTFYYPGTAPTTTSFVINRVVRYVKVQLRGQDYLTLAEVQVWGPALPEIDVQGNGVSIANGDSTPTSANLTDFGNLLPGSTSAHTFTIRNQGAAALTLSGSPRVTLSGNSAFHISQQPAGSSVAANSSTTFAITFAPNAVGVVTDTVSIANDDSNENPYTFVVSGRGVTPNAQLNGVNCLLIDAINAANTDAASGTCPAGNGADTITLLQDVTLSAVDNADYANSGANGLPQISSAITIEGGGHTISRTVNAPAFRFFFVPDGGALMLNHLTLSNGDVTPDHRKGGAFHIAYGGTATVNHSTFSGNQGGFSGAIYNNGALTVNDSTISGNSASGNGGGLENWGKLTVNHSTFSSNNAGPNGGGLYNAGTLTVTNSTVSANSAGAGGGFFNMGTLAVTNSTVSANNAGSGGGLFNANGTATVNNSTFAANAVPGIGNGGGLFNNSGTVTVNNSTFAANTAGNGAGGIYNNDTVTVNNSTFVANSAVGYAGGIANNGTLTVTNSTFSTNSAGSGGGIDGIAGALTLNRTLLAGNSAEIGPEIRIRSGTVNANSANLIGYGGSARSVGFTPGATDIVPGGALTTILTTTLANNGGGTQTLALVPCSPAIDAAGVSSLATDQRGVTRPQGSAADIGAFELTGVACPSPEIDVQGKGISIASGATSPSSANDTAFGSMDVSSGTVVHTFTIRNTGTGPLTLSGTPRVAVSGPQAGDFTVTQPAVSSIAAGGSTTFTVTFDPSAVGVRTAMVTLANNDSDEGSYTFTVQGTGAQSLQPTSQLTQQGSYSYVGSCTGSYPSRNCTLAFTLKNTSGGQLQIRYEQITAISSHVAVLNGTPSPGGVNTVVNDVQSVANNAMFQPTFQLRLTSNLAYTLRFKIYGYAGNSVAAAGADQAQAVELGEFEATVTPDVAGNVQLFLPVIQR